MPRAYDLTTRAARQEETRRRIVEAAVALHRSVGPARTETTAIAELAGVERVTVYRHFPRQEQLLAACSQHFRATNPPPDLAPFVAVRDPRRRLAAALDAAYAYYEDNEEMMAGVLRDAAVMPVGAGFVAFQKALADCVSKGWNLRGRGRTALRAAVGLAADFNTWRLLVRGHRLSRAGAVDLMVRSVTSAAAPDRG